MLFNGYSHIYFILDNSSVCLSNYGGTKMNWGAWLQGLISSAASAAVTVITALIILPQCPAGWQFFVIAVGPFLINFLSYIKQTPPPIKTPLTPLIIIPLIIPLFFLSGCAGSWEKKSVASYELIGVLPATTCQQIESLCKSNTFPYQQKCPSIKSTCNNSRKVYITAGNILSLAIDTTDSIQKDRLKQDYYLLINDFNRILQEVIIIGIDTGVIKK